MTQEHHPFSIFSKERYISLTTYYKSGKEVATPVDFILEEEKIFIGTALNSYKVKRLRNNNKASIAPCNMRGKLKGDPIDVIGKILEGQEAAYTKTKLDDIYSGIFYKILFAFGKLAFWRKKPENIYIEFILA